MRTRVGWRLLAGLCVLTAVLAFGVPGALAAFHGIGVAKQCSSPVKIGDPYTCAVQILNTVDTGHDTLRVTGLSDTVLASAGPVSTGNILPSTALVFTGPVTCTGGTGTGTSADPYIGATECLLPFGSSIVTKPFSHYTVQPGDFNLPTVTQLAAPAAAGATNVKLDRTALAVGDSFTIDPNGANPETRVATAVGTSGVGGTGVSFATPLAFAHAAGVRVDLFAHRLADGATVDWNNTCTFDPDNDCTTNAQQTTVGASALVQKLASATATDIHNAAHQTVAVVDVGTTVHDFVTVSGQPTSPTPTGNVLFEWFLNGSCSGTAQSSATLGPLNGSGQFDASTFAFTPNGAGFRAFRATYLGDAIYDGSVGGCEPLKVVDANIQLTPPTATNRIGSPHVLTCHINVNDGNGFANAPAGTVCTVSIISGPGAPASQNCATDAAGSCQVTIGSVATGLSTIRASTNVAVAGLTIHRQTGDAHVGDSADAQKLWMNARISIAPNATNEINQLHTFTVTLETDTGSGFSPAAGKTVTVTLSGINGANPNPAGPFTGTTDANGQFAVTFKSATPGKIVGHASASLSVAGSAQFTVETDASGGSSGDAVKTFVDANIQLTPATATNPIATNHTLHCHVNVNAGDGSGFVNAPAGTQCTVNIIAGPGTPATQSCTTVGATGTCDVVITSATAGTTTLQATTTVSVGSVSLTRTTGDAHAGDGPNAAKTWAGARISIAPSATNEVGQSHTFTVTLETDAGSGFGPAAGGHVDVILTDASGASHTAPTGTCTDAGANTNAAGQCTITFTSNSAGTVTAHATAALSIGGQPVTVATSGVAPNSGDAVKTFVDANIQLTPATATNPLGTNHVLHCHINVNDGSGFVNAPAGTVCTVNIIAGPGTPATQNCTTIGSTGTCDATITSATAGTTTIQATTTVSVGGISLTRTTGDANAGDGPNASKTWAGARISIASSATNAVGQSHTFTVKLETDGGSGFVPAAGVHVDVTLTDANGANHAAPSGTCTNAGANTNAAGECTITFVSNTAGTVT
ncbi:MAG: hypothetical protein ACJ76U_04320, partial [Gaiellaceae bacterium]